MVAVRLLPGWAMVSEFCDRQIRDFRHHLEADAAFAEHDRREIEADAEFLEIDRRLTALHAAAGRRGRAAVTVEHRKFAAGDESCGFAGNRGQVRLGERMNDAGLFHRLQRRADRGKAAGDARTAERLPGGGKRIRVVEIDHGGAIVERAGKIDAELLDDVALDFGDDDFEHDLIAAAHDDGIDDFAAVRNHIGSRDPEQPRRDIEGLLRLVRARYRAGQDHAVADTLDRDVGIRQDLVDRLADAVEVARNGDIKSGDLLAFGIEEVHVGLSDRAADDEDAARGAHDGVGDLGIGHQHILDVARQIDHDRFADRQAPSAAIHNRWRRHGSAAPAAC